MPALPAAGSNVDQLLARWLTANGTTDPVTTPPAVGATIQTGDIEIGAVEIKNATTDDRAVVADNAGADTGDLGLVVHSPGTRDRLPAAFTGGGGVKAGLVDALPTGTNAVGRVGHDVTGLGDGRKVVAVAGTAEALAVSTPCKRVTIVAETDNTGVIAVGASTVVAALATRRGVPLNAGDTYELDVDNLADVFLDTTVNGDGVTFTYLT